jgi:putative radical SAM enzyme (TIGR03279 family)
VLEIAAVSDCSPSARAGLRPGDKILQVGGRPVRDLLDFHFYLGDEDEVELELLRGTAKEIVRLQREGDPDLGLTFAPLRTRLCGNDCVFCFVDQNPAGLRPTLYVKDEDYRLSFLHGNFVTLTNLKEWEIERIIEQRLSPIYISVHSMDPAIRRQLLRSRVERDIRPILDRFRERGITMHTQIVLVPGYNDGEDLERTITGLAAYHPAVESLAVVPLGMTEHREGLVELAPVTAELAKNTVAQVERRQREFHRQWGIRFVHLADEWYRLLQRPVPPATHYDGFPQIENGIGMTRDFLNRLGRLRRLFPPEMHGRRATLVTGILFQPILEPAVRRRLSRTGEPVELQVVGATNRFFGPRVTVAGLLVGRDIAAALDGIDPGDRVFIPPATINADGLFLDDMSLPELEQRLGVPVAAGLREGL